MELFGQKSRVIIEVETAAGDRLQFPIEAQYIVRRPEDPNGPLVSAARTSYSELRIPMRAGWLHHVLDTLDSYTFTTGRD
jgi:hypothetical protein